MRKSGPVYLYKNSELEKIESFIENEYGHFEEVIHELVSPDIHLDIAIVPPNEYQPYYKLVTMGAGAYKMNVPRELKSYKLEYAEYVIFLPKEWDIKSDKEEYYWAIRQLKNIARFQLIRIPGLHMDIPLLQMKITVLSLKIQNLIALY